MTLLSFAHSRLMKVKAGPSVAPGTYPIEPDLAESWTQPTETTYVFKLRKGVRWHTKPPVNGRELTAEDVKYTYERFLTIKGNGNKPVLEMVDRIEALDSYTVRFTLSGAVRLVARRPGRDVDLDRRAGGGGEVRRPEEAGGVIGTGPWMLERYEPERQGACSCDTRVTSCRGCPTRTRWRCSIDPDPASRFAGWLSGQYDFGPEYQQVVRRLDLETAGNASRASTPRNISGSPAAISSFKLDQEPFKDVRVRRAMHAGSTGGRRSRRMPSRRATACRTPRCRRPLRRVGHPDRSAPARGPGALRVRHPPRRGSSSPRPGIPAGFKVPLETTGGYGPDYMDAVQIDLKGWKDAGIDRRPQAQGVRRVHLDARSTAGSTR